MSFLSIFVPFSQAISVKVQIVKTANYKEMDDEY